MYRLKSYRILMESPIIRQLIFPGLLCRGGPGLQFRSAAIVVRLGAW